jgi:cytochrome c oxidase subunit IV
MSEQGSEAAGHAVGSTKLFLTVWVWLVAITGFEVFLGYERLQPQVMLALLVALSLVKAALIVSYFMHLKYEKPSLALILIPPAIFCICMILIFFFPDSWRLLQIRSAIGG